MWIVWFWRVLLLISAQAAAAADYRIVGDSIPQPLTETPGNAQNGRLVFLDRDRGHCLLCHRVASLGAEFQGNIGPDLSRVGERLRAAQLRLRLVDSTILNPATVMPAYFRTEDLQQVSENYRGKPVLSAQEVEDVLTYLMTLTADND